MDAQAVLMGFKRKAVSLGATFIQAEVDEVLHASGAVHGVRSTNGATLTAKVVVSSAGAWGQNLARTAGIELPIDPVMRQVFVLQTATARNTYRLTVFPSGSEPDRQDGGQFVCAKSLDSDPIGFDFTWHREKFMDVLWAELVEYVPAFYGSKVVSGWAGLYDVNRFDGNVLLGEWPDLRGFSAGQRLLRPWFPAVSRCRPLPSRYLSAGLMSRSTYQSSRPSASWRTGRSLRGMGSWYRDQYSVII